MGVRGGVKRRSKWHAWAATGLKGQRVGSLIAGDGELLREHGDLGALVQTLLQFRRRADESGRDRSASRLLLPPGAEADALGLGAGEGLLRALERGAEGVELGGCGVARGRLACDNALVCGEGGCVVGVGGEDCGAAELLELGGAAGRGGEDCG